MYKMKKTQPRYLRQHLTKIFLGLKHFKKDENSPLSSEPNSDILFWHINAESRTDSLPSN